MVLAKPADEKKKVEGIVYVLPKEFLINLSDSHFAKLSVALVLPEDQAPAAGAAGTDPRGLYDVRVEWAVESGRPRMTIGQTLDLRPGSVVSLNRLAGEPVDLLINGKPIARGEVVVIDEEFGLRITDVVAGS